MTVEIYQGVKMTPTHKYIDVDKFDFILDGKMMKIECSDMDIYLPLDAVREIVCTYDTDEEPALE